MDLNRPPLLARGRALPLGARTYIMAILNLTDDSFSGDGIGDDVDAALRRAADALHEGADVLDVGAESARADVPSRDPQEEATLVGDVVRRITSELSALVSIDTYKPAVAEAALQAGASIVNDIGGLKHDRRTADAAAKYGAALVINYTWERPKVRPATPPERDDLIGEHLAFLRERTALALAAGVGDQSVIVDPGIAFGKSHDEDLEVLRRLGEFRTLGRPLLVAASRKHFIGSVTGLAPGERDEATGAVTALTIANGADIVRVHNVPMAVRAVRIADAIVRAAPGAYAPGPGTWPWARDAAPIPGTAISEHPHGTSPAG